jgi:putative ABC transport system substrate-binding protein
MKRRKALEALTGLPLFGASALTFSQPASRVRRIGWLVTGSVANLDEARAYVHEIDVGLRRRGWTPGKNVNYEIRVGDSDLLEQYAMELVRLDVDLLIAFGDPATRAAMRSTSTIPIVFSGANDPIGSGVITSLSRPTGNVTGYALLWEEQRVKRIEALRELVPQVRTIAVLRPGPTTAESPKMDAIAEEAHAKIGVRVIWLNVGNVASEAEIETAIDSAARHRVDALFVIFCCETAATIATAALRHRLPSFGAFPQLAESGILLSLSVDFNERYETVGDFADRILRGSKPADLPVHQATRFEIVVNRKTARALGIRVPQSLLVRARIVG